MKMKLIPEVAYMALTMTLGTATDGGDPRNLPLPDPAKAKAWLQEHPELLKLGHNKDR